MSIGWYTEANAGESWRDASSMFKDWHTANVDVQGLGKFGYGQGDVLDTGEAVFHRFDIPENQGERVALFESWAQSIGRRYGREMNGAVRLSDGGEVALSSAASAPLPTWLR